MAARVLFDTSFLSALVDREAPVRPRPVGVTGTVQSRLSHLFKCLDHEKAEIVIPSPALAEVLSRSDASPTVVLPLLDEQMRVRIVPFDGRAAVEFGELFRGRSADLGPSSTGKVKLKFDLLILAIARVESVSVLYSDDDDLCRRARAAGIRSFSFWDLDEPPQVELFHT